MKKKIKALLVDDEIGAIRTLRGMLQKYFPQIHILGFSHSVNDGVQKAIDLNPDLVFLDIEMPPFGSGFDFIEKCEKNNIRFGVVFTTAYPKYAIKAINDIQPWAYLVKPFSIDSLGKAIEKAEEKISMLEEDGNNHFKQTSIVIPDLRKGKIVVPVADIVFCQADGSSADIYYLKNKEVVSVSISNTLKFLESQLPEDSFFRSHHSFLVHLAFVDRLKQTGRNGQVCLKHNIEVPISVLKLDAFSKKLAAFHNPE